MEPLERLGDFLRLLGDKFVSFEEGANALEFSARERLFLIDLATKVESATWALERISEEMHTLASDIEKMKAPDEPEEPGDVDGSEEAPQPEVETSLFPLRD